MLTCSIAQNNGQKPRPVGTEGLAQKSQQQRPQLLPQGAQIRPASSVSTQTGINQLLTPKIPKVRTKQTPVRPAGPNIKVSQQQPTMQQVVTSAGNK